jgi:aerobic-type carbon monoxide dehydrogenase small subunit (CoxS/CutS family)
VTIEGISNKGELHPVQQAFIDKGAIQCGYCTPGFVMSSVMLLDEIRKPNAYEIKEAISGNLCRCTGYYSIVAAIEQAAQNI